MTISVQITSYGTEILDAELGAIASRAGSLRPIWPEIGDRLERIMEEQFDTEGARGGDIWEPLSHAYLARKFTRGESLETLKRTDAMYDALTGSTPASVRDEGDHSYQFGADLDSFRIQQDWNPGNNFPERRPINLTVADGEMIRNLVEAWVMGRVNRRGQFTSKGKFTGGKL